MIRRAYRESDSWDTYTSALQIPHSYSKEISLHIILQLKFSFPQKQPKYINLGILILGVLRLLMKGWEVHSNLPFPLLFPQLSPLSLSPLQLVGAQWLQNPVSSLQIILISLVDQLSHITVYPA